MAAPYVEAATHCIRRHIENASGPLPPPFLVEFLLNDWRRHLAIVHRDEGGESRAWQAADAMTERLLWSVSPKEGAAERNALRAALEGLVEGLKHGMNVAGTPPDRRQEFLKALAGFHLALLSGDRSTSTSGKVPTDTVTIDLRDPRYRQLVDLLQDGNVEHLEI